MEVLNKTQKARASIRGFKTIAEALFLRGYYKPGGESGKTLEMALRTISPEIYGLMNDPHRVELDGLTYVMDRLPMGIEECTRITLCTLEGLSDGFSPIIPLKRRRTSYRVSEKEMCFEITRGRSEVYDILTHLTFLYIEARKIRDRGYLEHGETQEWLQLEEVVRKKNFTQSLDQEIWNLSKILGRTFNETRDAYSRLECNRDKFNSGLFNIVYWLGKRAREAEEAKANEHIVIFTTSLVIDDHHYGERWARDIKDALHRLGLSERELHIVSANMHSVINLLYGHAVTNFTHQDIYSMAQLLRKSTAEVRAYAEKYGCHYLTDRSGTHIDCELIDTTKIDLQSIHPQVVVDPARMEKDRPVILVMDYAFGEQAFQVFDELLKPYQGRGLPVKSISIMGKAGILEGEKGDIMLPTAHIFEGITDTYLCQNQLREEDFNGMRVYRGSVVTVLGTSLQNKDVLMYFLESSWHAIGLEMEGGHYQKAIQSAILRGHIPHDVVLRYAYYASDNPLRSGQTLASGGMGEEGIKPAYLITKVLLEKIL